MKSTKSAPNSNYFLNTKKDVLLDFKKVSKRHLLTKHTTDDSTYSIRCLNDIIYNEKAHVVSVFKDYLIYDDMSEFLKRYI